MPEPEIFQCALRALNVRAGQTVFVGDHPEADVHGAKAVGMKAVWMQDEYWPEPEDAVIAQLWDLPGVIDGLNKQN